MDSQASPPHLSKKALHHSPPCGHLSLRQSQLCKEAGTSQAPKAARCKEKNYFREAGALVVTLLPRLQVFTTLSSPPTPPNTHMHKHAAHCPPTHTHIVRDNPPPKSTLHLQRNQSLFRKQTPTRSPKENNQTEKPQTLLAFSH